MINIVIPITWFFFAVASGCIARDKGYSEFWFGLAGILTGYLALLIVILLPNKNKEI